MTEIKQLMEHIEEELEDAHTYAALALEYKTKDPTTSELYHKLSEEEMDHMRRLHKAVERLIDSYRRQKGEPPAAMMAVYDHLHKRAIAQAEKVGVLQALYNK